MVPSLTSASLGARGEWLSNEKSEIEKHRETKKHKNHCSNFDLATNSVPNRLIDFYFQ
jgi:hypothetical protein